MDTPIYALPGENWDNCEELYLSIQDTLNDTTLQQPSIRVYRKERRHLKPGWYVMYWIGDDPIERGYYLGDNLKSIKRSFNLWVRRWVV